MLLVLLLLLHAFNGWPQGKKEYRILTIAFYKLENLFDTFDDPYNFDEDRTPTGKDRWTPQVYQRKLQNMALAISRISYETPGTTPAIMGVCEVENRTTLEGLLAQAPLIDEDYWIIHYDSPDLWGIGVALLYKKKNFYTPKYRLLSIVHLRSENATKRILIRDQLGSPDYWKAKKYMFGEPLAFGIGGVRKSNYRRAAAATLSRRITDSLQLLDPYARIINMDDFNDDPPDPGLVHILGTKDKKEDMQLRHYFNPMASMYKKVSAPLLIGTTGKAD